MAGAATATEPANWVVASKGVAAAPPAEVTKAIEDGLKALDSRGAFKDDSDRLATILATFAAHLSKHDDSFAALDAAAEAAAAAAAAADVKVPGITAEEAAALRASLAAMALKVERLEGAAAAASQTAAADSERNNTSHSRTTLKLAELATGLGANAEEARRAVDAAKEEAHAMVQSESAAVTAGVRRRADMETERLERLIHDAVTDRPTDSGLDVAAIKRCRAVGPGG